MKPKIFLYILTLSFALLGIASIAKCISTTKDNIIIKQNDKEIIVRKYKTNISLNKNLKSFNCKIDSSLWKYPQNKILYDGTLTKAEHNPHKVTIKIKYKKIKNGKTYIITTIKDVTKYFSCRQVKKIEKKLNKRIIITKVFFPKEKIMYKFP